MDEIILNFHYKGKIVEMQCKRDENMNDIFKRYANKINKNVNEIYFINNGDLLKNNLKLKEINNKDKEINILVYDFNSNNNNKKRTIEKKLKVSYVQNVERTV